MAHRSRQVFYLFLDGINQNKLSQFCAFDVTIDLFLLLLGDALALCDLLHNSLKERILSIICCFLICHRLLGQFQDFIIDDAEQLALLF